MPYSSRSVYDRPSDETTGELILRLRSIQVQTGKPMAALIEEACRRWMDRWVVEIDPYGSAVMCDALSVEDRIENGVEIDGIIYYYRTLPGEQAAQYVRRSQAHAVLREAAIERGEDLPSSADLVRSEPIRLNGTFDAPNPFG